MATEETRKILLGEEESSPSAWPCAVCLKMLQPDGDTPVQRDRSFQELLGATRATGLDSVGKSLPRYQLEPSHWLFLVQFCIMKPFHVQQWD